MSERPLILVTNDDGAQAQGLRELARLMARLGDVAVVAPDGPRSGAACSITCGRPVSARVLERRPGFTVMSCSGTPTDCVKLALEHLLPRRPALVVSGINHGDNASVNLHYSGTVGAALEACMKGLPAVAYSLRSRAGECDFAPYAAVTLDVARLVLARGLARDVCLNVNFPLVPRLLGTRVCRMARGAWSSEWAADGGEGRWRLTGRFTNLEPEADDTDCWAMDHGMAAVTPVRLDVTDAPSMAALRELER